METLNEVEESLNPYSSLFMLFWAVAMIVVASFRPGAKNDLTTKRSPATTRIKASTLYRTLDTRSVTTLKQVNLAIINSID